MRELDIKLRHARQVGVICLAQRFTVHDAREVAHGRPGARELFKRLFERIDDVAPGGGRLGRRDLGNGFVCLGEQLVQSRRYVFGFDGGPV